jgi:site-specific recombinase XerD
MSTMSGSRSTGQDKAWLDTLQHNGRSPKTVASYATALLNLQRFLHRRDITDARKIKASDLEAWQQSLNSCAPSTQEQFARVVGYWLRWLVKQGELFGNPAAALRKTTLPRRLVRCPSEVEMARLLGSMTGRSPAAKRNMALCETAYGTGARLAELVQLKVSSLHLDERLILLHGKGDRDRMVPLTRLAGKHLRHYLARARGRLLGTLPDHGALFISTRAGRALSSAGIARVLEAAGRRVGLILTPHDYRRAFATHLLRGGAKPGQVKELLGHRTYRHLGRYLQSCPPALKPPHRIPSP